jgi:hypothetical protein
VYELAKWIDTNGEHTGVLVVVNGASLSVPLDPANTDYQNIMKLVDEGELVIQPADQPTE